MAPRFGTDGVRGQAFTEITPQFVFQLGRAAARSLGGGRMLLAHDSRRSGLALSAAFAAGALSEGVDVDFLGVLPTPAVAMLAGHEAVAAAMVTASHNPAADNGVKLFAVGGRKLTDAQQVAVEEALEALDHASADATTEEFSTLSGTLRRRTDAAEMYGDLLCDVLGPDRLRGLRVVVDTANGAMSAVAAPILSRLGAAVVSMADVPDGQNINAGCGATAPLAAGERVVVEGAHLGLAFDGDGDRVIALDEHGDVVDGDRLIALSAIDRQRRGTLAHHTVVVTVMANLGFHRAMEAAGISVVTTAVGDRYVLDALDAGGFVLGGEQSGHVIHRDVAPTGDGLLAGLLLADFVQRSARPLSELASGVMMSFPQVLRNVRVAHRPDPTVDIAAQLASEIEEAEARLGHDGRVLVRASGTEPLVRVMVEARDAELADAVCDDLVVAVERHWH